VVTFRIIREYTPSKKEEKLVDDINWTGKLKHEDRPEFWNLIGILHAESNEGIKILSI